MDKAHSNAKGVRAPYPAARLESLKWLALAAMLVDHGGKIVWWWWLEPSHAIGRLAWPLFALLVGTRLAERPERARRYLDWLLPFAVLAAPAYVAVAGEWRLDVLFTLAAGVALVDGRRHPVRAGVALLLSPLCEFGVVGVATIPALAWLTRRFGYRAAAAACGPLALLANLPTDQPLLALPALLASPVALLLPAALPRAPRWLFYGVYPVHLYGLWAWFQWVIPDP